MSDLMLDVGLANELKLAFRREGNRESNWTGERIKRLADTPGLLSSVLDVMDGNAEIKPIPFVRRLSTEPVVIPETDGSRTIAGALDVFPNFIDGDFVNQGLNVPDEPTLEMKVVVDEQIRDGKSRQIYDGYGVPLERLCLTQHQIVLFFEREAEKYLRGDGWAGFRFLVKRKSDGKFFVVYACRRADGDRKAYVGPLSCEYVWFAGYRYRFVLPQL